MVALLGGRWNRIYVTNGDADADVNATVTVSGWCRCSDWWRGVCVLYAGSRVCVGVYSQVCVPSMVGESGQSACHISNRMMGRSSWSSGGFSEGGVAFATRCEVRLRARGVSPSQSK